VPNRPHARRQPVPCVPATCPRKGQLDRQRRPRDLPALAAPEGVAARQGVKARGAVDVVWRSATQRSARLLLQRRRRSWSAVVGGLRVRRDAPVRSQRRVWSAGSAEAANLSAALGGLLRGDWDRVWSRSGRCPAASMIICRHAGVRVSARFAAGSGRAAPAWQPRGVHVEERATRGRPPGWAESADGGTTQENPAATPDLSHRRSSRTFSGGMTARPRAPASALTVPICTACPRRPGGRACVTVRGPPRKAPA